MIYADNAATTKFDEEIFEKIKPLVLEEYFNPSQPYSFSRKNKRILKESREIIADCINANPDEIYFTSSGTESDNWAIKATTLFSKNSGVITTNIEHHAVLNSCECIEKLGCNVKYLSVEEDGRLNPKKLEKEISLGYNLVSVMTANNEIGTVQDINTLCEIAHRNDIIFHTDAVQAIGHIDIDVKDSKVDLLSASAHKFNGPRGIGFLYIKKGTDIKPFMDGGLQEMGYRSGTENIPSIYAMALALEKNKRSIYENNVKLKLIEKEFFKVLDENKLDYIHNGGNIRVPGNISISIKKADGEQLLHRLDLMGICISTGSACNGSDTEISHVIKAVKVPEDYAKGTVRISFGKLNTMDEAVEVAKAIIKVVRKYN